MHRFTRLEDDDAVSLPVGGNCPRLLRSQVPGDAMKAYMVRTNKTIEPFGEHPGACLVLNKELSDLQERALKDLGLLLEVTNDASLVKDPDEHILFEDALYFTPELLSAFISRSRKACATTVCALKPGVSTLRSVVATQDVRVYADRVEYGLTYQPKEELRGPSLPVVIDPDRFFEFLPMPEHIFGGREYRIPLSDLEIVSIDHWTNLWAANMLGLLANGASLKKASKLKLLGLAIKAGSFNQWKVLRQTNRIGHHCDIHPTAYVEGSQIGDNVRVGAGAIVRECLVGAGTFIGSNVTLELSVVGGNCTIINGCTIQYSVIYPRALVNSRFLNVSVCGRDTFVGDGVTFADFRFDGKPVTVIKNGVKVDTGNAFVGSCLGHGAYLGSGCVVAPGRVIPNGLRISPEKQRVIGSLDFDGSLPGHRLMEVAREVVKR